MSSSSLPPPPPSADASGAPASPPLHSRLAPGEGGWRCRGCGASRRAVEPARGARCRSREPGAATLRPPPPPPPARLEGLRGESRSARPAAPANLPAPRWGVCPAAWLRRGRLGVFSWPPASSAFGKLQSQQPAGPRGRVQPGCANFDARASRRGAGASAAGGAGAGVAARGGGAGAGEGARTCPRRRSAAQTGLWLNLPWNLQQ